MTPVSTGPAKAGHYDGDDDTTFAAAWSAFATDDAGASAPHALEARVLEAAREACRYQHAAYPIPRWQRLVVALGTAAALALVAAGLPSRRTADPPMPNVQVSTGTNVEHLQRAPSASPGDRAVVATVPNGDVPATARRGDALVTLAVDPVQDTEQLALVHIRVTQDALMALGIATNEPGASGLVDVEVLVGGDGLPRDIRRMRTMLTDETTIGD
jgi:hypothetical protein